MDGNRLKKKKTNTPNRTLLVARCINIIENILYKNCWYPEIKIVYFIVGLRYSRAGTLLRELVLCFFYISLVHVYAMRVPIIND